MSRGTNENDKNGCALYTNKKRQKVVEENYENEKYSKPYEHRNTKFSTFIHSEDYPTMPRYVLNCRSESITLLKMRKIVNDNNVLAAVMCLESFPPYFFFLLKTMINPYSYNIMHKSDKRIIQVLPFIIICNITIV